jgi:hypothetical protein
MYLVERGCAQPNKSPSSLASRQRSRRSAVREFVRQASRRALTMFFAQYRTIHLPFAFLALLQHASSRPRKPQDCSVAQGGWTDHAKRPSANQRIQIARPLVLVGIGAGACGYTGSLCSDSIRFCIVATMSSWELMWAAALASSDSTFTRRPMVSLSKACARP